MDIILRDISMTTPGRNRRREWSRPLGVGPSGAPGRAETCRAPPPLVEASTAPYVPNRDVSRRVTPRSPRYSRGGGQASLLPESRHFREHFSVLGSLLTLLKS